jgi:iron(III) transport system ATP-binding protein
MVPPPVSSHPVPPTLARPATERGVGIEIDTLVADYGADPVLRGIDLAVSPGEIVALLGPSGCGKTTLLRCIAGLEQPRSGTIRLGEVDVTSGRGVRAERRRVGMVFQDGALFSHRTVLDNVNYGIERGPDRDERARQVLRLVGLDDKAARMPATLSGGEQQRVALARALAPGPGIVLLDEPFSSLDASLRVQLRDEVRRLLTDLGVTAFLVTHDQEEALSFGDRVAVMDAGLIQQVGTPEQIYTTPATAWVARFVGEATLLPARCSGAAAETVLGTAHIVPTGNVAATVLVRPEQLELATDGASVVSKVSYVGSTTRYEVIVTGVPDPVIVRSNGTPDRRVDDRVTVSIKNTLVHAWPAPG